MSGMRKVTWHDLAEANRACRGMDVNLFFPSGVDGDDDREAKKVCARCEVREKCLQYALDNAIVYGVWGGTNQTQRKRILKRMGRWADGQQGEEGEEGEAA